MYHPIEWRELKNSPQNLVNELKGDRVGILIFAGNAYLQTPLTTDYAAAQLFLRTANPDMAPSQGTAISDVIDLAENLFADENKNHKALVVITDGENHDEETLQRAKEANENGLMIFTVGVGTAEGEFIPINYGNRQDYKRDETGNPVRTKINEQMLRDLANTGSGDYFNIREGDAVSVALRERINRLEKREFETRAFEEYESYFQYFIGIALLFLIIEFLISYGKSSWLEGKDLFG